MIESLQKENRDLKEQIRVKGPNAPSTLQQDIISAEKLDKDLLVWKRKHDEMRNKS